MAKQYTQSTEKKDKTIDPRNFTVVNGKMRSLLSQHESRVKPRVKAARDIRFVPHVAPDMKAKGDLKQGDTYIPVRLVDSNIRRELPEILNYLTTPVRQLVFEPKGDFLPSRTAQQPLEREFTRVCRYENWVTPWLRAVDGAATHAIDAVRLDLDADMDGNFLVSHVGRENLIIDTDLEGGIESQEIIGQRVPLSGFELLELVQDGQFAKEVVDSILASSTSGSPTSADPMQDALNRIYDVYEFFFKTIEQGETFVYRCWHHKEATKYLKKPTRLFLGRRDMNKPLRGKDGIDDFAPFYEKEFPFFFLYYSESENTRIADIKSRVALDEATQEAASALLSGIVNGAVRSVPVYGSPERNNNPDPGAKPPKVISLKMEDGQFMDKPYRFFSKPGPDPILLAALNAVTTQNAGEQSNIDVATRNRKDSRKTATELKMASAESQELSSLSLALFSQTFLACYSRAYSIFRNRVITGRITVSDDVRFLIMAGRYTLRSAGDVDIVERKRILEKMLAFWPIYQQTAAASVFLRHMTSHAFPELSEELNGALVSSGQDMQLIQQLAALVEQLSTGEDGELRPELDGMEEQLEALNEQVQGVLAGAAAPGGAQGGAPQQQQQEQFA